MFAVHEAVVGAVDDERVRQHRGREAADDLTDGAIERGAFAQLCSGNGAKTANADAGSGG